MNYLCIVFLNRFKMKVYYIFLKLLFVGLTFLFLTNVNGQNEFNPKNEFTMKLQLRPKLEIRDGAFSPHVKGDEVAGLISQRSRMTMQYKYNDVLTIKISPQLVSVWGQDPLTQGAGINNGFGLFESWAKIRLDSFSGIVIGRQVIALDDERFFGELDWKQGGRSFDAVSYQLDKEKISFKGYAAYNQNYRQLYDNNLSNPTGNLFSPVGAAPYKWMQTLWTKYSFNEKNNISLLATNLGFQNASNVDDTAKTVYNQTFGLNYFNTYSTWNLNISAYYQTGKNASEKKVSAYMLALGLNKKIANKMNLGLGAELLSGDDYGVNAGESKIFTPYFATGHKFYGSMDYYYAGSSHKGVGLGDFFIKANYASGSKWTWNLALHQFVTPNNVISLLKEYNKNLGQEADLAFAYKIYKDVTLKGGYSAYFTTSTINFLKNSIQSKKIQNFAWLSLNIQPQVLKFNN